MTLLASVEFVDRELAEKYLASMGKNRALQAKKVAYFEGIIARGEWKLTTDAIGIDSNGALINGQHRLSAIVASERTLPFLVVRGLDPDAFTVLDTGARRTASQAFTLSEWKNSSIAAAAVRLIFNYDRNSMNVTMQYTNDQMISWATKHREPIERWTRYSKTMQSQLPVSASGIAAFGYICERQHGEDDALKYLDAVKTGENLSKGDPRLAARNFLVNRNANPNEKAKIEMGVLIVGFNYWISGRHSQAIKGWRYGDPYPRIVSAASYDDA